MKVSLDDIAYVLNMIFYEAKPIITVENERLVFNGDSSVFGLEELRKLLNSNQSANSNIVINTQERTALSALKTAIIIYNENSLEYGHGSVQVQRKTFLSCLSLAQNYENVLKNLQAFEIDISKAEIKLINNNTQMVIKPLSWPNSDSKIPCELETSLNEKNIYFSTDKDFIYFPTASGLSGQITYLATLHTLFKDYKEKSKIQNPDKSPLQSLGIFIKSPASKIQYITKKEIKNTLDIGTSSHIGSLITNVMFKENSVIKALNDLYNNTPDEDIITLDQYNNAVRGKQCYDTDKEKIKSLGELLKHRRTLPSLIIAPKLK